MRIVTRTLGEISVTLGAFLLLFLVWQLWWTDIEANGEAHDIVAATEKAFDHRQDQPTDEDDADPSEPSVEVSPSPVSDALIHLPTISQTRPVMPGVELSVLNQGVLGEYPESETPGEIGNYALAGHRTTYGRPLWDIAELRVGDPIIVETAQAYFVYRFDRTEVIDPTQTEVLADVPGDRSATATVASMVLTACHPKFSAAQRIAAFASFDFRQPRADGPPAALGG